MPTAELDTPKLRKQVIDRVQTLDARSLTKLLYIIDTNNFLDEDDIDDDDDVVIDLDFPTPQTPEEARKEIEEIEEEIRQGKFVTHEEGMAMIDTMIKEYETRLVG